mmetsp:Transcript_19598/g.36016  ORF Transcript_19598/g.36016 Transcript_19598/m.36016 type:complete len:600 (+) Transcript_19598:34-1833(+)
MEMEEPVSLEEEELGIDQAQPVISEPSIDVGPEVLIMTVEIGDGRQDTLTVRELDDPSALAADFAAKHGLNKTLEKTLEQLIKQNRDLVERRATSVSPDMAGWKDWLKPNSTLDPYIFQEAFSSRANTPQVNGKNPKIVEKRGNGESAFGKLYQLGKGRRASVLSSVTSNTLTRSTSEACFNYGEWLYIKGRKMNEAKRKRIEKKQKKKEIAELKGVTSIPQINKQPPTVPTKDTAKPEDRLAKKAQDKKAHIEKLKSDRTKKELKECSFKPKLNKLSVQIQLSKGTEAPRYEELFEEAKKLAEKKKKALEDKEREFNYSPCIDLTCSKTISETGGDVVERLLSSRKKFEEKMSRMRLEVDGRDSTDSELGHRMFTPSTGRASSARNSIGKSIFEHLYSMKDHKKQVVEQLAEKRQQELSENSVHLNESSASIFNSFRRKQYERLFRMLDVDNDGAITPSDVQMACLDNDVMRVLNPLFIELEVGNLKVTFEAFMKKVDALLAPLTVTDRATILKRDSKLELEETQFKPTISKITEAYAMRKRGVKPASLYERGLREKKLADEKFELEAKLKLEEEKKQCPFKPATTPYLTRKQRKAIK